MEKNIDVFNRLSECKKEEAHKEFKSYLNDPLFSLNLLSQKFNEITSMKTDRKSVSKLMIDLGYDKKSDDLIKKSKQQISIAKAEKTAKAQLEEATKLLLKDFKKEEITELYDSGASLTKLEELTSVSVYYIGLIFDSWGIEKRDLPKTHLDIIKDLRAKGYSNENLKEQYHDKNITMKEFVQLMSNIVGYDITLRMGERIVSLEGLQKPSSKVKENQAIRSRGMLVETMRNIKKSGFENFQEIADFFYKEKTLTYEDLAAYLNKNLDDNDRKFTISWLERNVMPLLPADRMIGVSRVELSVRSFIETLVDEDDFISSYRKLISPFEVDFYFPSRSLAIEVNGLYWHSEKFGKDKNYHLRKFKKCQEKGVQLISVWEDDWANNRDVVKKMLSHKLGVSAVPKIGARKTIVDLNVPLDEVCAMLESNHIQGHINGSHYIGLRIPDTNQLVAAMVLIKKADELEISRYATDRTVQGGFTKLLKAVESNFKPSKISTFSDNEISDGSLYDSNGFEIAYELKPDYKYVQGLRRKHKFLFRKSKFRSNPALKFEEGKTERELAIMNGLYRVYDSGKIKWVKTFD